MNPLAMKLNEYLQTKYPTIYSLLSKRGHSAFFPKLGILGQAAEAKGKEINATIGIATEEDGSPMRLDSIHTLIDLDPKDVLPYAPSYGKPALRDQWQSMLCTKNPTLADQSFSRPVVTHALTHGLSICGALFVNQGDEIILPDLLF